jgi:DNA-binding transcriptional ArsR family regulator
MIESIITSKTRIKLLLKFFLNSQTKSYLRNLEQEFGESSNAIRIELNRLEDAGLLKSEVEGNRKLFSANVLHPLYNDINSILRKITGIDSVVERVIRNIGNLESAYVTGEFARGIDSKVIELLLVGNNLDADYIKLLVDKAEELISRKIHFLILTSEQIINYFDKVPKLLIWKSE